MIKVEGKAGISATILLDSISPLGNRLVTYVIEYPRIILAELNTHRMLSKNSSSSRAIPFHKMMENLDGIPVRFGAANAGMQDKGEDFESAVDLDAYEMIYNAVGAWVIAKEWAVKASKAFYKAGYHKQVYNRLVEPFQMMKTIISATEWDNFFWLRDDEMADPSLHELARCMREAREQSVPQILEYGDWHLPYVESYTTKFHEQGFYIESEDGKEYLEIEDAIKVSCARCAAVSYRNEDYGLEKCKELYDRLVGSEKKHASALEHCGKVMQPATWSNFNTRANSVGSWEEGISHVDKQENLWSGNFKGFIQYRKTIQGENYNG